MPATMEVTDRMQAILFAVKEHQPCSAATIAEAFSPGSDPRGAAQTIRRMSQWVTRTPEGYRLTDAGRAKVNRMTK